MNDGQGLPRGTGYITPGVRILFLVLASVPGGLLLIGAGISPAKDFVPALAIGGACFIFCLIGLLLMGRAFEYVRDREWQTSPDSLSNASWPVRIGVFAFIGISAALGVVQAVGKGVPLPAALVMYAIDALFLWLLAHFFAVKIIRFVQRFLKLGKQSL